MTYSEQVIYNRVKLLQSQIAQIRKEISELDASLDNTNTGTFTQTTADGLYAPIVHTHTFTSITGKPTTLSGYGITDAFTQSISDGLYSALGHTHTFTSLTNKPTTLSGYGITDAFTQSIADGLYSPVSHTHTFASIVSKPTTISGYGITDAFTQTLADARYSLLSHTHTFASLTSKPTTLSGYGITDAYPLTGNPSGFLTSYTETDPLALKISNNLSDLVNVTTARTNLGLGSMATKNSLLAGDIPDVSATYATQSQLTTTNNNVSTLQNAGYVTGATDATLTKTGGTLGLNLANSNTWTATIVMNMASGMAYQSSTSTVNGNLALGSVGGISISTAKMQIGGATTTYSRMWSAGNVNAVPSAGAAYGSFIIAPQGATIASSGTHPLFAQEAIRPLTITAGAGILTNSATLYLEDAATGAQNNYNLWAAGTGTNRLDGKTIFGATVRLKGYTVATLPTGTTGDMAYVTDASSPSWNTTVAGGGSSIVTVFYNGTNWICK